MLLVDTATGTTRTLALRDAIDSLTNASIRRAAYTQHNGDGTHGNCVFAGSAASSQRSGEIKLTVPTEPFDASRALDVDGIAVQLTYIRAARATNGSDTAGYGDGTMPGCPA